MDLTRRGLERYQLKKYSKYRVEFTVEDSEGTCGLASLCGPSILK